MRWRPLSVLVLACASGSCASDSPAPQPSDVRPSSPPPGPRLVLERAWAPPLDVYPIPFGMGPGPTFLVRAREGTGHALAWIGPERPSLFFSRTGDGPGEVRDTPVLAVEGGSLAAFDMANMRIVWWDSTGAMLREVRLDMLPLLSGPGDSTRWIGTLLDEEGRSVVSVDVHSGHSAPITPTQDSFAVSEFGSAAQGSPRLASAGRWNGGVLLSNGRSYRIAGYDWEGRRRFVIAPDLEPNLPGPANLERLIEGWRRAGRPGGSEVQARARLARRPQQFFSHLAPPRVDTRGRIWVLVNHGDSLFADAWWRDSLLVRTALECPGGASRWNLAGDRLALVCSAPPEDTVNDVVFWIWRIEDQPPSNGR